MKKVRAEVCTLFEGSYHKGVATFINSLCKFGYEGNIWVGYRGDLPPWIKNFKKIENSDFLKIIINESVSINFIHLESKIHFANYKPQFFIKVKNMSCQDVQGLFYFDPDIIVNQKWEFFENWLSYGNTLCVDPWMSFSSDHPLRRRREELLSKYGYNSIKTNSVYYNSGFVGVAFSDIRFIELWVELLELFMKENIIDEQPGWNTDKDWAVNYFSKVEDQDIMNLACQLCDSKFSSIGPDGMGFKYGFIAMFHFTGQPKPWNRKNIIEIVARGKMPSYGQKVFMSFLKYPIKIHSDWMITLKKIDLFIAKILARFISIK